MSWLNLKDEWNAVGKSADQPLSKELEHSGAAGWCPTLQ
jgi:hypothetical protein